MTEQEYRDNIYARFGKPPAGMPLCKWLADMENGKMRGRLGSQVVNTANDDASRKATERRQQLCDLIATALKDGGMTRAQICEAIKKPISPVRYAVATMRQEGLITFSREVDSMGLWTLEDRE